MWLGTRDEGDREDNLTAYIALKAVFLCVGPRDQDPGPLFVVCWLSTRIQIPQGVFMLFADASSGDTGCPPYSSVEAERGRTTTWRLHSRTINYNTRYWIVQIVQINHK